MLTERFPGRVRRRLWPTAVAFVVLGSGIAGGILAPGAAHAQTCGPWMNASQTPGQRADELLSVMTLAQKDQLLVGTGDGYYYGAADEIPGIPSLCIPNQVFNDAGQGLGDGQANTTAFPAPIATAASWDPSLAATFGQAVGKEAWEKGINVWLAPGMNIARVPMNGRNFEYLGEDPYLAGQTASAMIRDAQQEHVIATAKHYALNNQETNRMTVSSDASERTMQEIYLPAFDTAVNQGGAGAVMCSYNRVNSIYACQDPALLTTYLKRRFGFTGYVMSDWGATHSTVAAANAGLDQEHSGGPGQYFGAALETAVQDGQVPMARFNDMARRVLVSMFRIGLFDHPAAPEPNGYAADADTPQADNVALQQAEQGSVLLKNQGPVLPLDRPGAKIAVIGPGAGPQGAQITYNGNGSAHVPLAGGDPKVVSPLQGIERRAAANGDVVTYADGSAIADATAAARAADVAVVFAYEEDSEGTDRPDLSMTTTRDCNLSGCASLPINEDQLITSVAQANPNTIVVLNTGGPVLMPWLSQVKSVLEAWYPGQENGNATAALLFGDVTPSGKLPITFPQSMNDIPTQSQQQYPGVTEAADSVGPHAVYSEGLNVGYRWYDDSGKQVLFPFGYGLSYTTFRYSNYALTGGSAGKPATVSFDVTNTGTRPGAEAAQVYVGSPANNYVNEPLHQLRAFAKTGVLQPGQTQHITASIGSRAVEYWDTTTHSWQPESGCHPVWVGGSSRDIELQGSGLDGSMGLVASCPASTSAYTFTSSGSR